MDTIGRVSRHYPLLTNKFDIKSNEITQIIHSVVLILIEKTSYRWSKLKEQTYIALIFCQALLTAYYYSLDFADHLLLRFIVKQDLNIINNKMTRNIFFHRVCLIE